MTRDAQTGERTGQGLSGVNAEFVASLGRKVADARASLTALEADLGSKAARDELRRKLHAMGTGARMLHFDVMARALAEVRALGVSHVVFGDLFLEDIRKYREANLFAAGMTGLFPLWKRDTARLAREMIASGLRATLTCIDPRRFDRSFAGRTFDAALLDALPSDVDPCGENGEFHTFVSAGPMFARPIEIELGEVVERDGFVFADVRSSE